MRIVHVGMLNNNSNLDQEEREDGQQMGYDEYKNYIIIIKINNLTDEQF